MKNKNCEIIYRTRLWARHAVAGPDNAPQKQFGELRPASVARTQTSAARGQQTSPDAEMKDTSDSQPTQCSRLVVVTTGSSAESRMRTSPGVKSQDWIQTMFGCHLHRSDRHQVGLETAHQRANVGILLSSAPHRRPSSLKQQPSPNTELP